MYDIGDYVIFNLPGSDEKQHENTDYLGKVLVLFTYPRDNTPGCTTEACGFRDLTDDFTQLNSVVLGLNHNSLTSHQNFINKHQLTFPLLIDEDFALLEPLGAKKEEDKVYRKTFIIDEYGKLEKVFEEVSPKSHPNEVLGYLESRKMA